MSITDELREYVGLGDGIVQCSIRAIADRIDESWEREEADFNLMCDKIAAQATCLVEVGEALGVSADQPDSEFFWELAEAARGCIPLPKDAEGETIHLQDRMSWDNGTFNVHELNLTADGWTTWDERHGYTVRADQCHHVTPDSWERIISDATALGSQMKRRTYQTGDLVERCKRLAGEE